MVSWRNAALRPSRRPAPCELDWYEVLVALATHDERRRAHRARDDPHVRASGPDGTLAGDPHLLAPVGLLDGVVVVAVDALGLDSVGHGRPQSRQCGVHHLLAVAPGVALGPEHVRHVGVELRPALRQPGQVAVLEDLTLLLGDQASRLDVGRGQLVADAPAARVQHDPDAVALVQADLDEVVAASEAAELHRRWSSSDARRARMPNPAVVPGPRAPAAHWPRNARAPFRHRPGSGRGASRGARRGRPAARLRVRLVSAATMPQPMSTPTAEGRSAFLVATTLPTVAPRPKCASAIRQTGPARIGSREVRSACSRALSSSSLAHEVRFAVDLLRHRVHFPSAWTQ